MANQKTFDVTVVLDRSGSMVLRKSDAIGSFNEFLAQQKKIDGHCHLTVVQFDDRHETYYEGDISGCLPLSDATFVPRGSTALFDALNRAIAGASSRRADNFTIAVITDGDENASREVTMEMLAATVKERKAEGWDFQFFGCAMERWSARMQGFYANSGTKGVMSGTVGDSIRSYGEQLTRSRTQGGES